MSSSALITSPDYAPKPTLVCRGDAVTMCLEALSGYMQTCLDAEGNPLFKSFFSQWATPSDDKGFPTGVVALAGEATADGEKLVPAVDDEPIADDAGVKWLLSSPTSYTLPLRVAITVTTKEQRKTVARALEAHLNPVVWMSGFRLEIPDYHGAVAQFLPQGMSFADSPVSAARRLLALVFRVQASMPVILPVKRKTMRVFATGVVE